MIALYRDEQLASISTEGGQLDRIGVDRLC
jgi:hypothetical protein